MRHNIDWPELIYGGHEASLGGRDDPLEVQPILGEGARFVEANQFQLATHVDPRGRDAEYALLLEPERS